MPLLANNERSVPNRGGIGILRVRTESARATPKVLLERQVAVFGPPPKA
jgi:hypothetical protein